VCSPYGFLFKLIYQIYTRWFTLRGGDNGKNLQNWTQKKLAQMMSSSLLSFRREECKISMFIESVKKKKVISSDIYYYPGARVN